MSKDKLRLIIREAIEEMDINFNEGRIGSHAAAKNMNKALKWIGQNMPDTRIIDVKSGHKICPPKDKSTECYTVHKGGKGIYDLYRFLAKVYGVSKHEIENAVSSNRKLNLLSVSREELELLPKAIINGKFWYVDEKNEKLIFVKNYKKTKSFEDLTDEEFEAVISAV